MPLQANVLLMVQADVEQRPLVYRGAEQHRVFFFLLFSCMTVVNVGVQSLLIIGQDC